MENYGYYPEDEENVKKGFSLGKLLKYVGAGIVLAVWILIIFRIWVAEDTAFSKKFMWTQESLEAYKESPDEFKIMEYDFHSYTRHYQNPDGSYESERFTRNNITDDGYFRVTNMMYVEATKELQFTVRYTTSAVEYLQTYYSLPNKPGGVPFHFVIYEDDVYFDDYTYTTDTRFTYTYCRLVFSGIDISEFDYLYLNVFYKEFADFEYPYSSLMIYDSYLKMSEYKLKKALPAELSDEIRYSDPVMIKNPPEGNDETED